MIKNSLKILLVSGMLLACGHPAKNPVTADTTQQATDITGAQQPTPVDTGKTTPADWLISPGRGIGHILLNSDVQQVIPTLGRADSSDAAMGSSLMVWYAGHKASGYMISIFSHRNMGNKDEIISRIQKILVTSPRFKTADGIGAGAALTDIKRFMI